MKVILATFTLLLTCVLAAQVTYAASGWYVGKEVGGFAESGFSLNAETYEPNKHYQPGYNFFGGYSFSTFFAVEGSYTDFGDQTEVRADMLPSQIYDLNALGFLPIIYGLSVFGKMGMRYAESYLYDGFDNNQQQEEVGLTYGLGLQYYVTQNIGLRLEWEHTEGIEEIDDNYVLAGVAYRF